MEYLLRYGEFDNKILLIFMTIMLALVILGFSFTRFVSAKSDQSATPEDNRPRVVINV